MNKTVFSYYLSLGLVSAAFIIATVLTASGTVDYGFQVKRLKIQQANLQQYSVQLSQQVAAEKSLDLAQQYALSQNFTAVNQVITLSNPLLASR